MGKISDFLFYVKNKHTGEQGWAKHPVPEQVPMITEDQTINVRLAPALNEYSSLSDAMDYLRSFELASDVNILVDMEAGAFDPSGFLNLSHPQGERISIVGQVDGGGIPTTVIGTGYVSLDAYSVLGNIENIKFVLPITSTSGGTTSYGSVELKTGSTIVSMNNCAFVDGELLVGTSANLSATGLAFTDAMFTVHGIAVVDGISCTGSWQEIQGYNRQYKQVDINSNAVCRFTGLCEFAYSGDGGSNMWAFNLNGGRVVFESATFNHDELAIKVDEIGSLTVGEIDFQGAGSNDVSAESGQINIGALAAGSNVANYLGVTNSYRSNGSAIFIG